MIISPINPQAQLNGRGTMGIYRINPAQTVRPSLRS